MKTAVFIPAYNAERLIGYVIKKIPRSIKKSDIVVVDDGSNDNTYKVAKQAGVTVLKHGKNKGYGGAQKTAYNYAIKNGYAIVVMVHADGQHDPKQIPEFVEMIENKKCDAVTGTRFRNGNALREMPIQRFVGNRLLTFFIRILTGLRLSEMHNGFRAYSTKALKSVRFNDNSDKFEFDTEILLRLKANGMKVGEVPIKTVYRGEKSNLNIYTYGSRIMRVVLRYFFLGKYRE